MTTRVVAGLVLIPFLCACAPPPDPDKLPVVELPGRTLTVSDLKSYIDANLMASSVGAEGEGEGEGDRASAQDLDEVRSRLLDNFVDEQLLDLEAERRGIKVEEQEIEAYLRSAEEASEPTLSIEKRRKAAKRNVAIQKLREGFVREQTSVTPDEVDAYLTRHRADLPAGRRVVLRSLLLPSEEQAQKVYADVRSRRTTFDAAVASSGTGTGQGEPLQVELGSLPDQVQQALSPLRPGEVSAPVVVHGSTYLFLVQAWSSRAQDEESLHRRAREDLLRQKYEEASRRLLDDLRAKVRPKIELANLPFHYVPERSDSHLP